MDHAHLRGRAVQPIEKATPDVVTDADNGGTLFDKPVSLGNRPRSVHSARIVSEMHHDWNVIYCTPEHSNHDRAIVHLYQRGLFVTDQRTVTASHHLVSIALPPMCSRQRLKADAGEWVINGRTEHRDYITKTADARGFQHIERKCARAFGFEPLFRRQQEMNSFVHSLDFMKGEQSNGLR